MDSAHPEVSPTKITMNSHGDVRMFPNTTPVVKLRMGSRKPA